MVNKIIADLHIHSKYSRACSKDLTPENLALWAKKKGIHVMGTGDFTHPKWVEELEEKLVEVKPGLYQLRPPSAFAKASADRLTPPEIGGGSAYFMFTAEVSSIYKQGDHVRRVHNLLLAPSLELVKKLIKALGERGVNLKADGRPIMGVKCDELVKICKDIDENIHIIPAHAWTPHFGVFGSLSGFNTLEEAFGDQAKYIFAIETGLSSDPAMNWQADFLDSIGLISNSDAHSLRKLGREANVFNIEESELSYKKIIEVIRNTDPKQFLYTIEFFPEEGKYHLDGHRDHKFSCLPEKTKKLNGICPVCGKKLLLGVLHRVDDLASRPLGYKPERAIPFKSIIPLEEIIAETLDVGVASKKVIALYEHMIAASSTSEFDILLDMSRQQLVDISNDHVAESIIRVREGRVHVEPGYDGEFGKIEIYSEQERQQLFKKTSQGALF